MLFVNFIIISSITTYSYLLLYWCIGFIISRYKWKYIKYIKYINNIKSNIITFLFNKYTAYKLPTRLYIIESHGITIIWIILFYRKPTPKIKIVSIHSVTSVLQTSFGYIPWPSHQFIRFVIAGLPRNRFVLLFMLYYLNCSLA